MSTDQDRIDLDPRRTYDWGVLVSTFACHGARAGAAQNPNVVGISVESVAQIEGMCCQTSNGEWRGIQYKAVGSK